MTHDRTGEVGKLLALARKRNSDDWIDFHDGTNSDGDKIVKHKVQIAPGTTKEIEVNVSNLYTAGVSTTSSVEILRIEAELYEEGRLGDNPHVPTNQEVLDKARAQIESEGNTPAWEAL